MSAHNRQPEGIRNRLLEGLHVPVCAALVGIALVIAVVATLSRFPNSRPNQTGQSSGDATSQ